ncbi:MAG: pyridoxine 5'-phosphate synthase [Pseudomonadales bacterium]|nr:pyridoxine 5'-phosphate synthase [Gammaproteobacteria bacterium]MBK6581902.1 pyridoxine 5'-phosphate synthase [Gammaproteobacteria bacterium]MBP6051878.1 pyridoxine 5'-phosphate synthase [Pseudomonadales bacterium]MBP6229419.1 pyridoxine 5'-phosphate synthase [Pseudomonadales bacterium]
MSICLSLNLNKIALIRNSRPGDYPSVTAHARLAVAAGADGITVHPRPDQRHIRASDVPALAAILDVELNVEGNPFAGAARSTRADVGDYPGFLPLVRAVKPAQCTLVPDDEQQLTSDHGFDLRRDGARLRPVIDELHALGIRASLFMDPDPQQMVLARAVGADRIELYTGPYAAAFAAGAAPRKILEPYIAAANSALDAGLGLNAGHDLNLLNLPDFARVPGLLEVSIGHAFTVDALHLGFERAVRAYRQCLGQIG